MDVYVCVCGGKRGIRIWVTGGTARSFDKPYRYKCGLLIVDPSLQIGKTNTFKNITSVLRILRFGTRILDSRNWQKSRFGFEIRIRVYHF